MNPENEFAELEAFIQGIVAKDEYRPMIDETTLTASFGRTRGMVIDGKIDPDRLDDLKRMIKQDLRKPIFWPVIDLLLELRSGTPDANLERRISSLINVLKGRKS